MRMAGRRVCRSKTEKPGEILLLTVMVIAAALMLACGGSSNPPYTSSTTSNPAPGVTLQAIKIIPATPLISIAENRRLTATGVYSDGSSTDLTSQVTWSSSSAPNSTTSVAVSSAGTATGVALGGSVVTATLGNVVGALQLIVDSNGYSSNTLAILSVPFQSAFVDAAYLPL